MVALDPLIGIPQQAATSGCGAPSPWNFDSTHHSNQTIHDRLFYVHIPASYSPNVSHSVVLSFHKFKEDDVQQEEISGFSQSGLEINGWVRALPFKSQRELLERILSVIGAQGRKMVIRLPAHGRVRRTPK
jgi:hypothetical protein